jgi:hypothetical protein
LIDNPPVAVVGTVMTTGDHPADFVLAQVAVEPVAAAPQV